MGFFEFDSEWAEEGEAASPSSSSPSTTRPATNSRGGPSTSSRPSTPTSTTRGTTSTTPAKTPASTGARAGTPARTAPATTGAGAAKAPTGGRPTAKTDKTEKPAKTERPKFDFGQFTKYVQQGIDFAKFGVQVGQQFAGARGGGAASSPMPAAGTPPAEPEPTAGAPTPTLDQTTGAPVSGTPTFPGAAPVPGAGGDQLALLLQALQQRQIPPLPGSFAPPGMAAPTPAPAPQMDGLALLQGILANPQFQHTMQSAAMGGGARNVYLPVPTPMQPHYQQPVPIPLGAVMNAIAQLAGRSMTELNAGTREEEPEVPAYLVDEQGEYVVDPANADDRAALVAHLFRMNAAASDSEEPLGEMDESEAWAREAGFIL